jgi:HECT-domain (ubiquitin-transferase)
MLLYGVPYIDVKDWKINTDYKGEYNGVHKVVKWFWEVM